MRVAWSLLVMVTACGAEGDDYPINTGGNYPPIGGLVDAARPDGAGGDGGDAGAQLAGRVCLISDLRNLEGCASTGADGLTVTVGTQTTTTGDDGAFTLSTPAGTNLRWRVTGAALVTSVMALGLVHTIPAIRTDAYGELLLDNGVVLSAAQGSIVVRVVQQGAGVAATRVTASPTPSYPTSYDGVSATLWDADSTGSFGVAWLPGAPVGASTLTVTPPASSALTATLSVEEQAITFVTVELP